MSVTSDEANYLVYRYLQESGFAHTAFAFGHESQLLKNDFKSAQVQPGALIKLLQKGLLYTEAELHVLEDGSERPCVRPVTLLEPHTCDASGAAAAAAAAANTARISAKKSAAAASTSSANVKASAEASAAAASAAAKEAKEKKRLKRAKDLAASANASNSEVSRNASANANATSVTSTTLTADSNSSNATEFATSDILILRGHADDVCACRWNPTRSQLATASADFTARLWDTSATMKMGAGMGIARAIVPGAVVLKHYEEGGPKEKCEVTCVDWNKPGTLLATGSYSGHTRIYTADGGLHKHTLIRPSSSSTASTQDMDIPPAPIIDVKWNKTGDAVLALGADHVAVVWSGETGVARVVISHFASNALEVDAPPPDADWKDKDTFALASRHVIGVFHADTSSESTPIRTFAGHYGDVFSVKWSPRGGAYLASCAEDHTVKIWSMSSDAPVAVLEHSRQKVHAIAWSPAGDNTLATISMTDDAVKLWDAPAGKCTTTIPLSTTRSSGSSSSSASSSSIQPLSLIFSPDARHLAVAVYDSQHSNFLVLVIHVKSKNTVKWYKTLASVYDVQWSAGGERLAVATDDRAVAVIDVKMAATRP